MVTKTYTFYWYPRTSKTQLDTTVNKINKTWTMPTARDCDRYAKYEANKWGHFKYEEYTP